MDPDTWLKDCGEHYKCIATNFNDLLLESKDLKGTVDALINKHHFKLKGTGPISYHLACDFERDGHGTLQFAPRKCVENIA